MKKKGDYKVGYGKPPTHSRFKKGESGNPSGKRRREPTLAEYLAKELSKTITLTENGQVRRVTKREAIAKRFVQMALQGDHRAQKRILDMNSAEQPVALEVPAWP